MTSKQVVQQALEALERITTVKCDGMDITPINDAFDNADKTIEALKAALSQQGEQQPVAWKVVTWNSKTTKSFLTKPEAMDYLTMNDADGDWHIEPVNPAPKEQKNAMELKQAFYDWYDALPDGEPTYQMTFEAGYKAALYAGAAPASQQGEQRCDTARVLEWMRTPNRKAAQFAFTEGPERQAAYWIEIAQGEQAAQSDELLESACSAAAAEGNRRGVKSTDALAIVAAFRNAGAAPTAPPQWQPIDTAPKDGTSILVCKDKNADGEPMGDSFGIFVQRAAWWEGEGWVVYCSSVREPQCFFEPSHWMPLPPAPGEATPAPHPDTRKVIEQMVVALEIAERHLAYIEITEAKAAGQKWLKENK